LRGKAIYITLGVLLFLIILMVLPDVTVMVGIHTDIIDMDIVAVDGTTAARQMLTTMDSLIFFLMPLFIVVAFAMFSCGAVKNEISTGMSRVKLYVSKLVLISVLCVLLMAVYLISGILVTSAFRGVGSWTAGYFLTILKAFGAQAVILIACSSIGVFLAFVTQRAAAVIGVFLAFMFVPSLIISLLANRFTSLTNLYHYDVTFCLKLFSYIENMSGAEIMRGLAVGVFWLLISTYAGIKIFKRAEIK
jgi:ABC-2 type transport system permease protein